jgi:single-strand DNA-binding protein
MSVNKFIGLGFVGQDPTINQTQDKKTIASFSLAMSQSWKGKDGNKQEKTEWIKVVAFGNLAEIVKNYVKKGSKVYVEGSIQTRKWTDKENIERFTTEIILQGFNSTIQLLDSKKDGNSSNDSQSDFVEQESNEEIPF